MARIVTQDCKAPYRATTAMCATLISSGAEGQNRTVDTSLFRAVLCQLSYLGTGGTLTTCFLRCQDGPERVHRCRTA